MDQYNALFMYSGWGGWAWVILPILIWSLFWKGCALWIAGKNNQKVWFLVLLVVNTVGILEIVYIFYVTKKKWADIQEILTIEKSSNQ